MSVLLLLLGLAGCDTRDAAQPGANPVSDFLLRHWVRPLVAQGAPPAHFSALEASLDARACGTCHDAQFKDWSTSLHSRAMGPGVLGQLLEMPPHATDEHQDCLRCHAPLKEQADSLVSALSQVRAVASRSAEDATIALHEQGLTCSACHVRGHQRYGPPRKDGSAPDATARLPHDGWTSTAAFGDSRFCASCHQFPEDGFALNGKLLENTYEEWKASRHGREGKTCQSCHMPERRHLWRGVHDPEMVKSGVTIEATVPHIQPGAVRSKLTIRNTGTGHLFPTYVTPKVILEGFQEDAGGQMLEATRRGYIIARQVAPDLSAEVADTRLPPDTEAVLDYRVALEPRAVSLVFRVRVEPDAFYTELYRSLLESGAASPGKGLIKKALQESLASQFMLYSRREKLQK